MRRSKKEKNSTKEHCCVPSRKCECLHSKQPPPNCCRRFSTAFSEDLTLALPHAPTLCLVRVTAPSSQRTCFRSPASPAVAPQPLSGLRTLKGARVPHTAKELHLNRSLCDQRGRLLRRTGPTTSLIVAGFAGPRRQLLECSSLDKTNHAVKRTHVEMRH